MCIRDRYFAAQAGLPAVSSVYVGTGPTPTVLTSGPGWGLVASIDLRPCPEVKGVASSVGATATWRYRPFAGGQPALGSTMSLEVITDFWCMGIHPPPDYVALYLSLGRLDWAHPSGLQVYLDPARMVPAGLTGSACPFHGGVATFSLAIPNAANLVGLELYAQAFRAWHFFSAFASTELLHFAIGC